MTACATRQRVFPFAAALLASLLSPATLAGDRQTPNPAAPAETSQYAFLIGEWECTTRMMGPDRNYVEGRATWIGRYILDGWAIQDLWESETPEGSRFQGTNIRSFDPATGKWDNRWLPQGSLQWKEFESEQRGETMVMIGGEGTDAVGSFIDRNTFHDIRSDSWRWRKDRSYDGGETWFEGVGFIEARRAGRPDGLEGLDGVEHGFVDNAGIKIHYASLGDGPLVVMLHGFPDYWYTWREQMAELSRDHRVVAIDLRGYNKSDKPEGVQSYAMSRLIADVVAVIHHFDGTPATVIGHDWGGAVAWMVATYVPDLVERLVVLSTPHPFGLRRELRENPEQQRNSAYARRFQEDGAHESLTAEELASWVEDTEVRARYVEAFRRSSIEGMLNYYKANYPRPASASGNAPAPQPPPPPGKIGCPVLVIHGLDDEALLPEGFNGTWEWVDGELTIVSLPGVGHFVQHEAGEVVTRTIADWLGRH